MSIKSGFFNSKEVQGVQDREYTSEDFAKCFSGFIADGIVALNKSTSTDFKVVKTSLNSDTITVRPGYAWINGRWAESDEDEQFKIPMPASTGMERWDRVCLRCDYDNRTFSIVVKNGEEAIPSLTPILPDLQDDAHAKEISLAYMQITQHSYTMEEVGLVDDRTLAEIKMHYNTLSGLIFGLIEEV